MDCIFCKITEKLVPADIVYEDSGLMVFKDIKPSAPIHLLIVPKMNGRHIDSINDLKNSEDEKMTASMFFTAKKIASDFGLDKSGYKLVFNVGRGGGQIVDHLHLHLLGGWQTAEEQRIP